MHGLEWETADSSKIIKDESLCQIKKYIEFGFDFATKGVKIHRPETNGLNND